MWATCEEAAPLHHGRPRPNTHSLAHSPDGTPSGGWTDRRHRRRQKPCGAHVRGIGHAVWNADDAAKQLYATDAALREAMVERWGDDIGAFDVVGNLVDIIVGHLLRSCSTMLRN